MYSMHIWWQNSLSRVRKNLAAAVAAFELVVEKYVASLVLRASIVLSKKLVMLTEIDSYWFDLQFALRSFAVALTFVAIASEKS